MSYPRGIRHVHVDVTIAILHVDYFQLTRFLRVCRPDLIRAHHPDTVHQEIL